MESHVDSKQTRNMISCIFQLNCKANAANLKLNFISIWSIRRESVDFPMHMVLYSLGRVERVFQ